MTVLYEYGKWARTSQPTILKRFLRDLWSEHLFIEPDEELSEDQQDTRYQPFLRFDGEQIRANNFVGFIQNENELIEIFPKVFRDVAEAEEKKALMLQHIFYWFEYCRKWRFPFTQSTLDTIECDKFPELIINLIANQFLEAVSNRPLSLFQPVEEALQLHRE